MSGMESRALRQIVSNRRYKDKLYWQIVHEWEDVLSRELGLRLLMPGKSVPERLMRAASASPVLRRALPSTPTLAFHMTPRARVPGGQVPIIIDFWKSVRPGDFYAAYKHCPLVYISSLEVMHYLQADGCPVNIRHLALSLPDIQQPLDAPDKVIDIIQPGRVNYVLSDYMSKLLVERPDIEYVKQQWVDGGLRYVSNKRGDLGAFASRRQYLDLLRSSRVALYSSPGVDEDFQRTGGFSPVTPRLLEMVAGHCLVAGRYADNADAEYFAVNEFCPNVREYSQFKALVEDYLERGDRHPTYRNYPAFLNKHYTSRRASQIASDFGGLRLIA